MPASLVGTFRVMAYNNAWANHRLLFACARLTQAELEASRTSFFPSITATLNHILIVDWFYVDSLEGGWLGPKAWADPTPCATVAALQREQAAVDRRLIAVCEALTEASLTARCGSTAATPRSRSIPPVGAGAPSRTSATKDAGKPASPSLTSNATPASVEA